MAMSFRVKSEGRSKTAKCRQDDLYKRILNSRQPWAVKEPVNASTSRPPVSIAVGTAVCPVPSGSREHSAITMLNARLASRCSNLAVSQASIWWAVLVTLLTMLGGQPISFRRALSSGTTRSTPAWLTPRRFLRSEGSSNDSPLMPERNHQKMPIQLRERAEPQVLDAQQVPQPGSRNCRVPMQAPAEL